VSAHARARESERARERASERERERERESKRERESARARVYDAFSILYTHLYIIFPTHHFLYPIYTDSTERYIILIFFLKWMVYSQFFHFPPILYNHIHRYRTSFFPPFLFISFPPHFLHPMLHRYRTLYYPHLFLIYFFHFLYPI
jgi:hypothetical protein